VSHQGAQVAVRATVTTVSGLAAVAGVLGDVGAPVQPMLVLWFVLVCPGMAVVGLIRPPSLLFALTLSIAISCALAVVVAQALLFAGAWSPVAALTILAALTTVGAGADLRADRRARRPPVDAGRSESR
jgi:hypothetical protein